MRKVGIISSGRADYGLLRPIMAKVQSSDRLQLVLFVTGAHLSPEFGETFKEIEQDGFSITEKISNLMEANTPESVAGSMGLATLGFSKAFARWRPDILLVLGDRSEIFAAASAAVPMQIPIAHVHGGESTQGSVDDTFRHCLTKMSHLHFVSCEDYARRVVQLGEQPWRVSVSGAPGLDNLRDLVPYSAKEFHQRFRIPLRGDSILVTFHPESVHPHQTGSQIVQFLAAIEDAARPVVFTYPNADAAGRIIIDSLKDYCASHTDAHIAVSLGTRAYATLMKNAALMVGNSSSGIIEAASFALPVVNVGIRQQGRIRPPNVIDARLNRLSISKAISRASSQGFHKSIDGMKNPFGDGHASRRIVQRLKQVKIDENLLIKRFFDIDQERFVQGQGVERCG